MKYVYNLNKYLIITKITRYNKKINNKMST